MSGAAAMIDLGDGAFLRPMVVGDVTEAYVEGLNDPLVNRFLVGPRSARQSMETVQSFVRMNSSDLHSTLFGFFLNGVLRGTVRVHGQEDGRHYLGLAIFDRSIWGQGWGGRLVSSVTDHSLSEMGLGGLFAVIEEENLGSQKAFKRAGYERLPAEDVVSNEVQKQMWKKERTSDDQAKAENA